MTGDAKGSSDADRMKNLEEERMRQRMMALERRVERSRTRERIFGLGLLVALVLAAVSAFTPHLLGVNSDGVDLELVSAQVIQLKDSDGVVRGRWQVDDEGNSRLRILDRQGRARLSLSVLSGGSPGMSFSNANARPRVALALLPDESTRLTFADGAGMPRTILGLSRGDDAHLVFYDADGEPQVSLGLDGSGEASMMVPEAADPDTVGQSGGL